MYNTIPDLTHKQIRLHANREVISISIGQGGTSGDERATDRTKVHRHGFYTRDRVLFIYSDQDILAKIDRAIYSVSAITKLIVSFHLFRNHLRAMREINGRKTTQSMESYNISNNNKCEYIINKYCNFSSSRSTA